jgi:hypothetical protein
LKKHFPSLLTAGNNSAVISNWFSVLYVTILYDLFATISLSNWNNCALMVYGGLLLVLLSSLSLSLLPLVLLFVNNHSPNKIRTRDSLKI